MPTEPVLAGRYRILRRLTDGPTATVWLAEDGETGFMVLAGVMPMSRAQLLRSAVGLPHPHLAPLLDLLDAQRAGPLPDGVTLERGACVAVAEWVPGSTLYEQLLDGRMSTVPAIRMVASVASAVSAMHARGAVHGAISTRSIVMNRTDGGTVPVLTQGVVPADGSFCSLERIEGGGPSEQDDTWALHVVLYNALTGRKPYRARSHDGLVRALRNARPIPLAALDVDDAALGDLLDSALVPGRHDELGRASDLETRLYSWLGEHGQPPSLRGPEQDDNSSLPHIEIGAFVDSSSSGLHVEMPTVMPPPAVTDVSAMPDEPRSAASDAIGEPTAARDEDDREAPASSGEPPDNREEDAAAPGHQPPRVVAPDTATRTDAQLPTADKQRGAWVLPVVAIAGASIIGATVWLVSWLRPWPGSHASANSPSASQPAAPAAPGATVSAAAASAFTAASGGARVPPAASQAAHARPGVSTPAEVAACTARWFPAETFHAGQDLSFVCSVPDPREAAKRMRRRVVVASRGVLTPGMSEWSRLGWYQLAAVAVVRGHCCPNQVAFELPQLRACPRLDGALDSLAEAVHAEVDPKAAVAGFETAAECAWRVQPQDYSYSMAPKSGGQFAFDELLARGGK